MDESLRRLLREKRGVLLRRWRDRVLETYAPEAARFMSREPDPFANPVGHTLTKLIEACLDQLIDESDPEATAALIGDAMRIRAVQSFRPSQAVGFLFDIKKVVREELDPESLTPGQVGALLDLESRVDELALRAFESYLESRERLYEIKATELRRRSERVLRGLEERALARAREERERSERGAKL